MRKFIILISLISILILSGCQQTDKDKLSDSNFQIVSLYWNNAIDWNLICNRCLNEGKDCKSENGLKIRMKVDTTRVINFPPIQWKETIIRKPPPLCPAEEAKWTYESLNQGDN